MTDNTIVYSFCRKELLLNSRGSQATFLPKITADKAFEPAIEKQTVKAEYKKLNPTYWKMLVTNTSHGISINDKVNCEAAMRSKATVMGKSSPNLTMTLLDKRNQMATNG